MKKQISTEPSQLEHHLQQFTDDHPIMQWLEKYGKILLISAAACLVVLFAIYRISSSNTAKAEADYLEATQQYALFQKKDDKAAFEKLQAILNRRPELHPKYDGLIAQTLLNRNDPQAAEPFIALLFSRLSNDHVPFYETFASISLLISQGNYPEALAQSKELQQTLLKNATIAKQERTFGDILFAYNLLRIAMLEQKAGTPEGEQAAWSEWTSYSKASTNSASIKAAPFYTLDSLFGEGSLTLNDYIKSRVKSTH